MTAGRLRVAIAHWAFPPTTGGVESHLADLARLLSARGCEVTVLTGEVDPVGQRLAREVAAQVAEEQVERARNVGVDVVGEHLSGTQRIVSDGVVIGGRWWYPTEDLAATTV